MAKVILICGKICSGKTWYAKKLSDHNHAVILSTDEVTFDLIENEQGEFYDLFAQRVNLYLRKKAVEIVRAGANVILDWGFWTKEDRREISDFLTTQGIEYEWHYIDIDDVRWEKNIAERNACIEQGTKGPDFYVNDGLLKKLESLFVPPETNEMDFIYVPDHPAAGLAGLEGQKDKAQ